MKKIISLLIIAVIATACVNTRSTEDGKPEITVSILPQEYFVKQIAGDFFDINVMVPPGASPATYEPTPAQLASLSKSKIYLQMGYTGFEMAWMEKLASTNKELNIYNLSEGLDLIMESSTQDMHKHMEEHDHGDHGHHHGGIDPHVWLSPVNAGQIAENILAALSENYPEGKKDFEKNYSEFRAEVESLNTHIKKELTGLKSRAFFTYHPALSYFARDYGLEQHPLELGGKTPSAGHMKMLVDMGREHMIGVVFLQMQFDQRNAEVLADEIGAEIVQINPLDPEWYEQMKFLTAKLKENLQ